MTKEKKSMSDSEGFEGKATIHFVFTGTPTPMLTVEKVELEPDVDIPPEEMIMIFKLATEEYLVRKYGKDTFMKIMKDLGEAIPVYISSEEDKNFSEN